LKDSKAFYMRESAVEESSTLLKTFSMSVNPDLRTIPELPKNWT
jgi:hypothetical protein